MLDLNLARWTGNGRHRFKPGAVLFVEMHYRCLEVILSERTDLSADFHGHFFQVISFCHGQDHAAHAFKGCFDLEFPFEPGQGGLQGFRFLPGTRGVSCWFRRHWLGGGSGIKGHVHFSGRCSHIQSPGLTITGLCRKLKKNTQFSFRFHTALGDPTSMD